MRIFVATGNKGKVQELSRALGELGIEFLGPDDLGVERWPAPEETGVTFDENAVLKARYYFRLSGMPTLADDSGLEVDALDGRPGVLSARYGSSDAERIGRLLGELGDLPASARAARFVCALALVGDTFAETFTGICAGRILHAPAGTGGFGYDPIFAPEGEDRSFAEMSPSEKSAVSHRGRAIRALAEFLRAGG